jgi:hypothetical protein
VRISFFDAGLVLMIGSRRISELRKENSDFIALKRKEADDAVLLLSEHVRRKVEEERRLNGQSYAFVLRRDET